MDLLGEACLAPLPQQRPSIACSSQGSVPTRAMLQLSFQICTGNPNAAHLMGGLRQST